MSIAIPSTENINLKNARDQYLLIQDSIETVIKGQSHTIRLLLAALVSGGHVLLEDYPGTGKTTLAKVLAKVVAADFKRIQFTPDLLPTDVVGLSVYNPREQIFSLHKGPVFTNILLADEINRASPRTQSALLESMAEAQVTIEGETHRLDEVFFVIATQNPVESHGTYPLPEAQMDRFALQLSLGYVSQQTEIEIVRTSSALSSRLAMSACVDTAGLLRLRQLAQAIQVSDELTEYIVTLVAKTREWPGVKLGASLRASMVLKQISQALAMFAGQSFVTPELIQESAVVVIAHRLMLDPQAQFSGKTNQSVVREIIEATPVPG